MVSDTRCWAPSVDVMLSLGVFTLLCVLSYQRSFLCSYHDDLIIGLPYGFSGCSGGGGQRVAAHSGSAVEGPRAEGAAGRSQQGAAPPAQDPEDL